jgi:tether containing UBX domain for GLUT4
VRIRFPDEYVIQGTFKALEKVEEVYKLVKDHLFNKEREFYLYETPPKKIASDMKITLK